MKTDYKIIVLFLIKITLGMVFIYASYHKIADPAQFAKTLYGYAVFPEISINILAIVVPFTELVAGLCLISGVFPRSALLLVNGLLLSFIVVVGFNLLRGHQFDCGCFSFSDQLSTMSNIYVLIRNILMLFAGVYLFKNTSAS